MTSNFLSSNINYQTDLKNSLNINTASCYSDISSLPPPPSYSPSSSSSTVRSPSTISQFTSNYNNTKSNNNQTYYNDRARDDHVFDNPSKTISIDINEYPEMVYVTDEAGIIIFLDEVNWNTFVEGNSEEPLPEYIQRCQFPSIVGRNLFEFIGDVKVQSFFRHIIYMLITGMQHRFVYNWYCDSPSHERKMSMIVTKLSSQGKKSILWRSKVVKETLLKPQQTYLNAPPVQVVAAELLPKKPTRTVCTYCKRILVSMTEIQDPSKTLNLIGELEGPCYDHEMLNDGGQPIPIIGYRGKLGQQYSATGKLTHLWLTAREYYALYFDDNIHINHGVCELCFEEMAMLFVPPGTFKEGERITPNSK